MPVGEGGTCVVCQIRWQSWEMTCTTALKFVTFLASLWVISHALNLELASVVSKHSHRYIAGELYIYDTVQWFTNIEYWVLWPIMLLTMNHSLIMPQSAGYLSPEFAKTVLCHYLYKKIFCAMLLSTLSCCSVYFTLCSCFVMVTVLQHIHSPGTVARRVAGLRDLGNFQS